MFCYGGVGEQPRFFLGQAKLSNQSAALVNTECAWYTISSYRSAGPLPIGQMHAMPSSLLVANTPIWSLTTIAAAIPVSISHLTYLLSGIEHGSFLYSGAYTDRLISFPLATKMFQFTKCCKYGFSMGRCTDHWDLQRVEHLMTLVHEDKNDQQLHTATEYTHTRFRMRKGTRPGSQSWLLACCSSGEQHVVHCCLPFSAAC